MATFKGRQGASCERMAHETEMCQFTVIALLVLLWVSFLMLLRARFACELLFCSVKYPLLHIRIFHGIGEVLFNH